MRIKESVPDRIFLTFVYILFTLIIIACVYPFYYSVIISFNEGRDAMMGGIYFWPRAFTLENYQIIFRDAMIIRAFGMTVLRTVVGTLAVLAFNSIFAYALSRKYLIGRKVYIYIGMFTMFFWGGIIPLYMLISALGLLNSFWVYIIPNLSGFFTVLIFIAFYNEIPSSILESARIDGANELVIFFKIVLPISTAVLATIALFAGVGHWNAWFETHIYIRDMNLQTLAYVLVRMINQGLAEEQLRASGQLMAMGAVGESTVTGNSIRLATMIVAVVPIMVIYPFLQKYFVKGIMLGAVKE